jgi:large-conductance mechanosensitive channel
LNRLGGSVRIASSALEKRGNHVIQEFRDFLFRGNIIELAVALAIAAAVFFFIVKPVRAMVARRKSPVEEGMADEERRHQELLAALGRVGSR